VTGVGGQVLGRWSLWSVGQHRSAGHLGCLHVRGAVIAGRSGGGLEHVTQVALSAPEKMNKTKRKQPEK
jgi:hypothetical protein